MSFLVEDCCMMKSIGLVFFFTCHTDSSSGRKKVDKVKHKKADRRSECVYSYALFVVNEDKSEEKSHEVK